MLNFLARRLLVALSVALTVSIVSFMLLHLSGDLATSIVGTEGSAEQVEQVRRQYGLDRPVVEQYVHWLGNAVRLDFGKSFFVPDEVSHLIAQRLPVTLKLGIVAMLLAIVIAVPLGVLAAVYRDGWLDRAVLVVAVLGQAVPSFAFSLLLIVVFAVWLHWLPVAGNSSWTHFVLPAAALAFHALPSLLRLTRAGLLDVLGEDYIRTAYAKGLGVRRVIFKHALRNAIVPVMALAAAELGFMLGGSIVIESIFSLQGLGQLAWDSISRNDFPVVQAVVLVIALFYIALSFVSDSLNAALDPRIRVQ